MEKMSKEDTETLSRYKAERARGIRHDYHWDIRMQKLQAHFDVCQREFWQKPPRHFATTTEVPEAQLVIDEIAKERANLEVACRGALKYITGAGIKFSERNKAAVRDKLIKALGDNDE